LIDILIIAGKASKVAEPRGNEYDLIKEDILAALNYAVKQLSDEEMRAIR
jgi:hypothetical protein